MYIVRDKSTNKILHINPAPLSQRLAGTDIYFQFDAKTMEVGRSENQTVPDHFDIDQKGFIVPWTLQQQIAAGVLQLPPDQKVVGDRIVEKTLTEKVAAGIVVLKPTEKVVDDRIEPKTTAEQVDDGIVKLSPTQILEGERIREMTAGEKVAAGLIPLDPHMKLVDKQLVPKSRAELARDGLIPLAPDEKVVKDQIVKLTPRQMFSEGRFDLEQYKANVLEQHTQACLEARRKVVHDHELLYAAIGALSAERLGEYRAKVAPFIDALDQARAAIQKAKTANKVDAVPKTYGGASGVRPAGGKPPVTDAPKAGRPGRSRSRRRTR